MADKPLPRIDSFNNKIDGPDDPRFAPIMDHLKTSGELADRVRKIFESTQVRVDEDDRINADDLAAAASRPLVHELDLEHCMIEVHEVRRYVVYYIQPKTTVPPQSWIERVVKVALGTVWDSMGVEGWCDVAPQPHAGVNYWVWGVIIHDVKLNAMNRGLFLTSIPQALSAAIGAID